MTSVESEPETALDEGITDAPDFQDVFSCVFGIDEPELRTYQLLLDNPDSTVEELSDRLDRDRSTVNRNLKTLRETELASRKRMLVDGVQTSLVCVFYAAEEYVADGAADEADVSGYIRAAADAEAEEDLDRALGLAVCAGTRVIDGEDLDMGVAEEVEYGLVTEWVNGLDSLQSALADPEVVEED